jgi:hypothetical protein
MSNAQINALERQAREARDRQNRPLISSLSAHITHSWHRAQRARDGVEEEMLQSARQRKAQYDDEKLAAIRRQGGSEEFMPLTALKCRAAESWILDVLSPTGDKPWKIDPTPVPELAQQITQAAQMMTMSEYMDGQLQSFEAFTRAQEIRQHLHEEVVKYAKDAAKKMETVIHDQMIEGDWEPIFREFVGDVVTYKVGIIKGPVVRKRKAMTWGVNDGRTVPQVKEKLKLEFERVSPFDLYPSPESRDINDGYLIERMRLTREYLVSCKDTPGFDNGAIDLVLESHGNAGYKRWTETDQERSENEDRPLENSLGKPGTIECLEYWGRVQGLLLMEWGFKEQELEPFAEYEVNAWLIDGVVIRAVLNPDPLGRRPYSKTSYEKVPGSFWGRSVPERMREVQNICNATARAMINNMGYASGPQIVIPDISRLPAGEDITSIYPGKIWQFENRRFTTERPIDNFTIDSRAEELMRVYQYYAQMADEHTGIPSYAHGNPQIGGAGGTASGLSMLLNSSAKGIKMVIADIDKDIFGTVLKRMYEWNMRFNPDESIKGDIAIYPRGALTLIIHEQLQMRRQQFLAATANDLDFQVTGLAGRAAVLRAIAEDLDLPAGDVVPSEEDLERRQAEQMAMQQQQAQQQALLQQQQMQQGNDAQQIQAAQLGMQRESHAMEMAERAQAAAQPAAVNE